MTTNLTLASIKPTRNNGAAITGSVTRKIGDQLGDIINVKSFGAVGDGVANDTSAIQAAFDAAYGSVDSPNGDSGKTSNKPVYFPEGTYLVRAPSAVTITGSSNVGGFLRLTVDSTANLKTGYIVTVTASSNSAVNGSWGVAVIDSTHVDLYQNNSRIAFTSTSDGTINTSALHLYYVWGAHIFGAGRFATTIISDSTGAGCAPISTNGFGYSRVEGIRFQGETAFDYNWDGTSTGGNGTASQSVTFLDCFFGASLATGYGLKIGAAQAMCSETSIINCYFASTTNSVAGIVNWNANATQQIIMGGNIAGFDRGIWVKVGNIENIIGVSFQNNTTYDIRIENGTQSGIFVAGCRTESVNFLQPQPDEPCTVLACTQANGTDGFFIGDAGCDMTVIGCYTLNGKLSGASSWNVINCQFGRSDWNAIGGPTAPTYAADYYVAKTSSYDMTNNAARESGALMTNEGAGGSVTFTLPKNAVNTDRVPKGTKFRFMVVAAQNLVVQAGASSTIRIAASTSSSGGTATSNTVGNVLDLVCTTDGGSTWVATSNVGTWTLA